MIVKKIWNTWVVSLIKYAVKNYNVLLIKICIIFDKVLESYKNYIALSKIERDYFLFG